MHAFLHNEAIFDLTLRPKTPLLIKSGRSGDDALDPTLADMSFVRMQRPGQVEEEVYIPGSSLRGVVRSHAEKLLRSINSKLACDPTRHQGERVGCFSNRSNTTALSGQEAYVDSCYACRIFGNTALAGRAKIGDLYLPSMLEPLFSRRYGVSIDRVTGAVAQGPFELEILTDAQFQGTITVRNYTLGQLGLVAATLLDLNDGLVPMGYGKSRGLGRVNLHFDRLRVRTLRQPNNSIQGIGALANSEQVHSYGLPTASEERITVNNSAPVTRERGFYTLTADHQVAIDWLEQLAGQWVDETETLLSSTTSKIDRKGEGAA